MHKTPRSVGLALVKFDERFLELSWHWLNDSETQVLTQTPVFTREEQQAWFASLPAKADYRIWGIALHGVPIGATGFKHIQDESAEFWCYIGDKDFWGQRLGGWVFQEMFEAARRMGLKMLDGRVLKSNDRSLRLCKASGFVEIGDDGTTLRLKKSLSP